MRGEYASFHARTETALRGDTLFVIATDKTGQQLLNTRRDFGTALGRMSNMPALNYALNSGRIEASNVFRGSNSGELSCAGGCPPRDAPTQIVI